MAKLQYIVLDSYPLANSALSLVQNVDEPSDSQRCRQWISDCELNDARFLVPAIAYYEVIRELYLRNATRKITRLQSFCFDPQRFIPLTTDHLTKAAIMWAQVRLSGQPTADPHAVDGDVILASQVLSLGLKATEYIVATKNAKHIRRFGLIADDWQNIKVSKL